MYNDITFFHYKLVAHHMVCQRICMESRQYLKLATHTHTHIHTQMSVYMYRRARTYTQGTRISLNDSTKYVLVCLQVALSAPPIPVYILHTLPE